MECGDIELDDDDPSSLLDQEEAAAEQATDELTAFREQWREELRLKQGQGSPALPRGQRSDEAYQQPEPEVQDKGTESVKKVKVHQLNTEEEAAGLYWLGAAAEKSGDMQAALLYYKRACQLVPDIDRKLHWEDPPHEREDNNEDSEPGFGSEEVDLVNQFQSLSIHSLGWCQPERQTKSTHISCLPIDVVRYILRWVVSSQLDMRSLEILSMVCRSLYCMAREQGLWRTACKRLWKDATSASSYGDSWRRMFILKPHLRFNGVYICKTSYVREGERSLDSFYKPYHTVVYYRYLRFFPDGSVMYHTSPGDPAHTVTRLCHKHSSESVLLGDYSHVGSKVVVEVWSHISPAPLARHKRGRGNRRQDVTYQQKFHMELCLGSNSNRRRCNQLRWEEYYCQSVHKPTGHSTQSHFNLDYTYSPFYFSRVKSYTTNSTGMLT